MDLLDYAKRNNPPVRTESVQQEIKVQVQSAVPITRAKRDKPYIDNDGGLVIPFECDRKYHWWAGGQSVEETLKEIAGD